MFDAKNVTTSLVRRGPEYFREWLKKWRAIARFIKPLYKFRALRPMVMVLVQKLERGPIFSQTWKDILLEFYGVSVGAYSYGACLDRGNFPPGTVVGRYCSFAAGVKIFRRNHPMERVSMHPLFYNSSLGLLSLDTIAPIIDNPLVVGNDCWVGEGVIIGPGCVRIGDGAVLAAGAVVTKDVPDYTIVGGNPARVIRNRFDLEDAKLVEETRWWEKDLEELLPMFEMLSATEVVDSKAFPSLVKVLMKERVDV